MSYLIGGDSGKEPVNSGEIKDVGFIPGSGKMQKDTATHSSILTWRIHGQRSLVGCSLWGCKESNTTEVTYHTHTHTHTHNLISFP